LNFDLLGEEFVWDYEFTKELILIFVPIAATIVSSKLFLNSWQIRKEKFQLRKEILNEFDKTFPYLTNKFYSLSFMIYHYYNLHEPIFNEQTKIYDDKLWFPSGKDMPHELPFKKFETELQELLQLYYAVSNSVSSLKSSLILYYENGNKIYEELKKLETINTDIHTAFDKMVYSKNVQDFLSNGDDVKRNYDLALASSNTIRKLLTNEKLKNPKT